MKPKIYKTWAIQWHSKNAVDGLTEYFIGDGNGGVLTFTSRSLARDYIREKYSYIRMRGDLRREPHGWRMPKAVRVNVTVAECTV